MLGNSNTQLWKVRGWGRAVVIWRAELPETGVRTAADREQGKGGIGHVRGLWRGGNFPDRIAEPPAAGYERNSRLGSPATKTSITRQLRIHPVENDVASHVSTATLVATVAQSCGEGRVIRG